MQTFYKLLSSVGVLGLLAACQTPSSIYPQTASNADTPANTTSANSVTATVATPAEPAPPALQLARCAQPIAVVAFVENPTSPGLRALRKDHNIQSTLPLLRTFSTQSNCFQVVSNQQLPAQLKSANKRGLPVLRVRASLDPAPALQGLTPTAGAQVSDKAATLSVQVLGRAGTQPQVIQSSGIQLGDLTQTLNEALGEGNVAKLKTTRWLTNSNTQRLAADYIEAFNALVQLGQNTPPKAAK